MSKQYIGLFNKECKNPEYFCRSKQLYLSREDVEFKHCLKKISHDMITTKRCGSLIEIEKWEEEKKAHKERYKKVMDSRKNNGMHVYN